MPTTIAEFPETTVAVLEHRGSPATILNSVGRFIEWRHHQGSTDLIGNTVRALFVDWLTGSGEALRDFPIYFHYIKRMPTVSEHEQMTDVYLPLRPSVSTPA